MVALFHSSTAPARGRSTRSSLADLLSGKYHGYCARTARCSDDDGTRYCRRCGGPGRATWWSGERSRGAPAAARGNIAERAHRSPEQDTTAPRLQNGADDPERSGSMGSRRAVRGDRVSWRAQAGLGQHGDLKPVAEPHAQRAELAGLVVQASRFPRRLGDARHRASGMVGTLPELQRVGFNYAKYAKDLRPQPALQCLVLQI